MNTMLHRLRAIIVLAIASSGLLFATTTAQAGSFYLTDDAITIDGTIEEAWGEPLISDGEEDSSRTLYCWDAESADWTELTSTDDCTTYVYDEAGQIDLVEAWFGVNETNMLLAFQTVTPMFSVHDMPNDEALYIFDESVMAAGIDHLPNDEAFSHDMVFSFDTEPVDGEETYDWYLVANIDYDVSFEVSVDEESSMLEIYQESDDTNGFQADEDTLVGSVDPTLSEVSIDGSGASDILEIRQNIENFYDVTGIAVGDEVGFRLETHSAEGDTTDAVVVTFDDSQAEVSVNSVVVGSSAAKRGNGLLPDKYADGIVTVYTDSADDQSETLQFTAYDRNVGVQVAAGDVNGDGVEDIVTLPFKKMNGPEVKVFDLTGSLLAEGKIDKKKGKGFDKKKKKTDAMIAMDGMGDMDMEEGMSDVEKSKKPLKVRQYYLAVGDLNDDDQDEIILAAGVGEGLLVDVLAMNDDSELIRINQFKGGEDTDEHYMTGSWVEVADVDNDGDGDEIVTAPFRGSSTFDVWDVSSDGETLEHLTSIEVGNGKPGYQRGLHIGAADGLIVANQHRPNGQVHVYDFADEDIETWELSRRINVGGLVGNVEINDDGAVLVAPFLRKQVAKYNADDDKVYTIETLSRGAFLDFLEVEEDEDEK